MSFLTKVKENMAEGNTFHHLDQSVAYEDINSGSYVTQKVEEREQEVPSSPPLRPPPFQLPTARPRDLIPQRNSSYGFVQPPIFN